MKGIRTLVLLGRARHSVRAGVSQKRHSAPSAQRTLITESGFTLVEIMVVLVVIGILAAAIIPQFIGTTHDAKVSTTKANVAELESAVRRFYVNMDRYPTADEGLKILVEAPTGEEKKWRGPYVNQVRADPWGNPFQYRVPGIHHPATFDIWSRGADGADGGEGEAIDIGNW
jgi:general secretion pathway protein G